MRNHEGGRRYMTESEREAFLKGRWKLFHLLI